MTLDIDENLLKKYEEMAWDRLNIINCRRVNIVSIILTLCTPIFLFVDFLNKERGLWTITPGYVLLFSNHLLLEFVALFFTVIYFEFKTELNTRKYLSLFYVYSFLLFLINLCAFMSGWTDQFIHAEISIYIMGCLVIAVFFYQKPKYSILMYLQSYVVFMIYVTTTQKDNNLLQGHYINGTLVVILASFLSIILSRMMQRDSIYKHNLEDIVEERTAKLKKSLETVERLDRLNLIDKMAATVGHEIRNPLTSIKGFLQLMMHKQHDPVDLEYFNIMISEVDRANSIITEFLSISRNKATILKWRNIKDVLTSILPLIRADTTYRNMQLSTDFREVPDILLNEQEITQLVLNLTRNGIEAMSEGGCLTLKIYQDHDEVILIVADEGPGIGQEVIDKLGTPFFTTKETGTGLGLVVCNSIAERHNAVLQIKSNSKGSSFEVHFKNLRKKNNLFEGYGIMN
ncbi:ATP-binding protein [Desulfitobacterium sp.]|uniref:ATP-binding protein n=1 Tax=Desulfitobacterium sp. TaxID=49981 RepID=UPI002BF99E3A|nr:ATP-binding protein [Desulfitobacterium sp.]HVJ49456.1 ATP-binding protein [Desulfitobacterium sp.]